MHILISSVLYVLLAHGVTFGQPLGNRPVLLVSKADDGPAGMPRFATLNEALEEASQMENPLILLDAGVHELDGPITAAMELRSRSVILPSRVARAPA